MSQEQVTNDFGERKEGPELQERLGDGRFGHAVVENSNLAELGRSPAETVLITGEIANGDGSGDAGDGDSADRAAVLL